MECNSQKTRRGDVAVFQSCLLFLFYYLFFAIGFLKIDIFSQNKEVSFVVSQTSWKCGEFNSIFSASTESCVFHSITYIINHWFF